ncbi:MAG: hypothetical protein R2827_15035 [Bdellovibrionales bacterium]
MIFDSLTHPTLDGTYLNSGEDCSFLTVVNQVKAAGLKGACAVGLPGIGGYEHESYFEKCSEYSELYPVAALDFSKNIPSELESIKNIGYRAIKIHPRRLEHDFTLDNLHEALSLAGDQGLVTFLCTYNFSSASSMREGLNFDGLVEVLGRKKMGRIVLLHGGGVELMRYAELVRHNENLLLDLSFTLLKYRGSSIDLDIEYLFNNFDRRICIGSDAPDFTPKQMVERFNELTKNLNADKIENIAYKNLYNFLEIK